MSVSEHVIRAVYSDRAIRLYQAYRSEIAVPALAAGRFVPPFSMGRMTCSAPQIARNEPGAADPDGGIPSKPITQTPCALRQHEERQDDGTSFLKD
jgi:hypothetical protein